MVMEINGFPKYLIYEDGRVFSKKNNIFLKLHLSGRDRLLEGGGYYKTCLSLNGKVFNKVIHRLVAEHYIPNPNNYKVVDHKDRNKLNNNVSNLRWTTFHINSQNTCKFRNNKSGHKGINFRTRDKLWRYEKKFKQYNIQKTSPLKRNVLCYKYIILLRIKARHFH